MASMSATTRLSFLDRLADRGDALAWASFHKQYGELLFNYARRLSASPEAAEDVAQEVELCVFRAMKNFRHGARKGCFRAYLRSAVVHALARRAKQQACREMSLDPSALALLAKTNEAQDTVWQREHYLHRLRCAMRHVAAELEPLTIEAFQLLAFEGKSAAETAVKLGISVDSAYQAKSRVIKRLREHIALQDTDLR